MQKQDLYALNSCHYSWLKTHHQLNMAIPILHWPVSVQKYSQPMKEISEFSSDKQNNFFKKKSNINGILPISQTASKLEQKDLKIYDLNPNSPL